MVNIARLVDDMTRKHGQLSFTEEAKALGDACPPARRGT
jgi:hypothetical protein